SSKLLGQQLKDSFSVNIVDTIPFNLLKKYKFENTIDLIVTTLDIKEDFKIRKIKVNSILSEENLSELRKIGLTKSKSKYYMNEVMNMIEKNCEIKNIDSLKKELNIMFGD
ncbi:MAG: BglG family transcription antiterminator, partial [Fusobacteriaceae bacterium]